jgi:hypothetical protein
MKGNWTITLFLIFGLLVFLIPTVHAVEGSFTIGSSGQTQDKPQSKLWFNDGTWWAIMADGSHVSFYKLTDSLFVKQTFADAIVDTSIGARADVLWNGTNLFVLMYSGSTGRLSKYSYNASTKTYSRLPGFPVPLSLASGSESAVMEQDSTGKLWIAYDPGTQIRVIWSTNAEHTSWNTTGMVLATIDSDDIAAIVAFDNRIGVMWSNQRSDSDNFGFRIHVDGASETTWGPVEIVDQGGQIADDHINFAVTPAQDVIAITKSSHGHDEINLFVRWHDSHAWDGPYFVTEHATRPIVVYDRDNQDVYVFYTDWSISTQEGKISYKKAPLANLIDLTLSSKVEFIVEPGANLNDVTSTKQMVDASTGLLVLAKASTLAYYKLLEILPSGTPPVNHAPAVNAGADQTITTLSTTLNGSVTDDGLPAGGTLTRTWSKVSGSGTVTFGSPNAAVTTATFSTTGGYVLRLSASDSALSASDNVTITVNPPNQAPVVNAGSPQTITLPNTASLNGSITDDGLPAGSILTVTWSKQSGPGTVTFGNLHAAVTSASFTAAGTYVLRLTGSDSALSAFADVTVTVNAAAPTNQLPVVNAGLELVVTQPNAATLNGSATDDGFGGSTLTVTWSPVSGPGIPGTVHFGNASMASTTATFDVTGTYVLQLSATDGTFTVSDQVTVTVVPAGSSTVVETRIVAKTDDAEEKGSDGSMDLTSGNVDLGTKPSGMRFLLPVPHGAHIVRAYVQFTVDNPQTGATALMIEGEASDNALTFGSSKHNIVNRLRTFNHVAWTPTSWPTKGTAGIDQQTPDLSAVIQEIVDRSGWASSQGLALIVAGTGVRQAVSYDTKPATAPLLHVEYVLP